jgi:MOSC domain-containing protein YiiM
LLSIPRNPYEERREMDHDAERIRGTTPRCLGRKQITTIKDLAVRVEQTGRTGWYFRVLQTGKVEAPSEFALVERPYPQWTVAESNNVMHHRKNDWAAAGALASCASLSESWKASLGRRAATQTTSSSATRLGGNGS